MASTATGKALRSSEPDLKVVLRYPDKDGETEEKIYPMYGQILAGLSNFFDTALSVDMKEKKAGEVILNDVQPYIFEKAMDLLQDPSAAFSMTFRDALELLGFYNMYEFVSGLALCDVVLSKHIASSTFGDLAHLIELTVTAHSHNLEKSTLQGTNCLKKDFENCPLRAAMLSVDLVSSLVPVFRLHPSCLPNGCSVQDLESPLFPKYFIKSMSCMFLSQHNEDPLRSPDLELYSIDPSEYSCQNQSRILEAQYNFQKAEWKQCDGNGFFTSLKKTMIGRKRNGTRMDWGIKRVRVSGVEHSYWKSPNSQDLEVPPRGPWVPEEISADKDVLLLVCGKNLNDDSDSSSN